MAKTTKKLNGELPIEFAKEVTKQTNLEFESGALLEKVSPVTRELLTYWNPNGNFAEVRNINFHKGQWQAILNTIYIHEVLKSKDVTDMYSSIAPDILTQMDFFSLRKEKHEHPKYCIKMATGTGKTWVLHALLIWQYLNSKYEETKSGRFSKNFLLVAPGLIVYERLLDAYLGKEIIETNEKGEQIFKRDFETSDIKKFEEVFLPQGYRQEVLGFIQSNTIKKKEIGSRENGMIAITNWHLLASDYEEPEMVQPLESPDIIVKKLLPLIPGTTAGHNSDVLDRNHIRGRQIEFLANLKDLVIFNDEAHHLGGDDAKIDSEEKLWQSAVTEISKNKKESFLQVDFSATPFTMKGGGQKITKLFFPHIITNFELKEAIHSGLVKIVAIDKRKGEGADALEFKAEREGEKVIGLSGGQRVMIGAGLSKLEILEESFEKFNEDGKKHPKMLIVCEDTRVIPFVMEFLKREKGLSENEVMEIHSNKKNEVVEKEWTEIKQKLFNMDGSKNPRVIVSVLMLREGFDVNNICVIVPLRSSTSSILLQQVIGRGLRKMWREPEYAELHEKNLINLLSKRIEPDNYLDFLHIVEHPEYEKFYYEELSPEDVVIIDKDLDREKVMGDLLNVELKEDYKDYDLFWPIIIQDKEEELKPLEINLKNLEIYPIHLSELKKLFVTEGDRFVSKEITKETRFGEYEVTAEIFSAKSYQQFLQKMVNAVSIIRVKTGKTKRSEQEFPVMQINSAKIAELIDNYIRKKLFNEEFDPLEGNNWRILLSTGSRIIEHIRKNISKAIYDFQNNLDIEDAEVIKKYFSEIKSIRMRETYSIEVAKSIYPLVAYPSNKGGFEKAFMEFIDGDSQVDRFLKIREYDYPFANIIYIREDGLLAHYFPDFMVKIKDNIYLVETKAERDLNNHNVIQKRKSTVDWCNKINELPEEERMNCKWHYALLGERTFYSMSANNSSTKEILKYAIMTKSKINGTLSDFFGEEDKY